MSLSIVADMNLTPEWIPWLNARGWEAAHWANVGKPDADDEAIMAWARSNAHAVFTRDLDFSRALALTESAGPSVIQMRGRLVTPANAGRHVESALRRFKLNLYKEPC